MKTFDGYLKLKFGDTYLLLAGGGEKKLTDLLTLFEQPANTNNILLTVGGTLLTVSLGARAFDNTTYLPLGGGIMNDEAVIARSSKSVSWHKGRLYPIIKTTSYTGYNSILSMKTTNGSWDLGVYTNDTAYLTFIMDTDYNANANNRTYQLTFPKSTGTLALTSLIPTKASWNYDDIYISSLTTSGNYLRWVKNGTNNDITIPYATNADTVDGEHASSFAHRQTWNNMVHSSNEYTWIAGGYSGGIWINYRTASGSCDGNITEYIFGNGKGGSLASITSGTFNGNCTGSAGSVAWGNVTGKPSTFTPSSHTHDYLPLSGGWMNDGAQVYFKGKGGSTSTYACMGYRSSVTGTMHASDGHNSSGAFYIWSNGYDASNDNGGLCIDDEGVTVFGAGDAANNFTAVFRVINEDNVAAGPMFYVLKNGNCYGVNYYTTSDRAKKQNISSFSEHIRKFQLKDTKKYAYGVIAQEVPEMFRDGEEGNMTVNYNSVLSYYIGKLENKVLKLEEEIKQLKRNNKWLH